MNSTAFMLSLEIASVLFNLGFILLIIKEKKNGWIFGVLASLLSAYYFYLSNYLSESVLYMFYAVMGVYGYMLWNRPRKMSIQKINGWFHPILIVVGGLCAYLLGSFMQRFDADKSFYDASSTVFSIAATFLEMYKVLSAWIYWIIINLFTVWLYASKGAWIYGTLMLLFAILSVKGLLEWQTKWKERLPQNT